MCAYMRARPATKLKVVRNSTLKRTLSRIYVPPFLQQSCVLLKALFKILPGYEHFSSGVHCNGGGGKKINFNLLKASAKLITE